MFLNPSTLGVRYQLPKASAWFIAALDRAGLVTVSAGNDFSVTFAFRLYGLGIAGNASGKLIGLPRASGLIGRFPRPVPFSIPSPCHRHQPDAPLVRLPLLIAALSIAPRDLPAIARTASHQPSGFAPAPTSRRMSKVA